MISRGSVIPSPETPPRRLQLILFQTLSRNYTFVPYLLYCTALYCTALSVVVIQRTACLLRLFVILIAVYYNLTNVDSRGFESETAGADSGFRPPKKECLSSGHVPFHLNRFPPE